jgi:hypothetical protein
MQEIKKDKTPPREHEQHEFVHYPIPRQKPRSTTDSIEKLEFNADVPIIKIETASINHRESEILPESLAEEVRVLFR